LIRIPQTSQSHFCGRSPDRRAGYENDTLQFSAGTVWGDKSADTFHAVADSGVAVVKDYTVGKDFVQGISISGGSFTLTDQGLSYGVGNNQFSLPRSSDESTNRSGISGDVQVDDLHQIQGHASDQGC
jgi:hypothetical protein